jgi:hypothetical protein
MNIWIDMADARTDEARETTRLITTLISAGAVFCPLNASVIWELYRQTPDSALRVAAVMDTLSLGACFAPAQDIRRREVLRYVESVVCETDATPLDLRELFVPIAGYACSNWILEFTSGWQVEDIERCTRVIEGELRRLTMCDLVRMRRDLPQPMRPAPPFREARKRRADFANGNVKRARRVEEEAVAREYVIPEIEKLPDEVRTAFLLGTAERQKDRYGGLMDDLQRSARVVRTEIETHLETGLNHGRRDRIQDFFDIDFLIVPRAYSHVLASRDKQIRDLMRGRLSQQDGPAFVGSLGELQRELSRMCPAMV